MTVKRIILLMLLISLIAVVPVFSKERVAVLDFEAKDVDESDAMAIADLFRSDLVATGQFIVLERGNMQSILDEHELQLKGLVNEASASEIGELLAVNYLFLGNLSKFGNKYILVIDKINVESGEIEKSTKKNTVNIDNFLELSSEAAAEMSGSSIVDIDTEKSKSGYDEATLTGYISEINFFHLADFTTIEINTKMMQSTDLQMRRNIYEANEKEGAVVNMLLNAVTFGIAGNFRQGFVELGWTSVGTTAAFALSLLLSDSPGLKVFTGLLYTATYVTGYASPFLYEAKYNQYMQDLLLVY